MMVFLQQMGLFLLPLIALSVYSVGLIVAKNRLWRSAHPLDAATLKGLLEALAGSGPVVARGMLPAEHTDAPSHPVVDLLDHWREAAPLRQVRAQSLLAELEDRQNYFPALANLSTLTGLFGTVCGMIISFLALRSGGGADPSALAGGIAQALVATALGLVTAIPSFAAHAVFQKRLLALTGQMETVLAALAASREREGVRA